MASDELASGELASDDVIFRGAFFRRIMLLIFQERFQSDALQLQSKIPLLFNSFSQDLL